MSDRQLRRADLFVADLGRMTVGVDVERPDELLFTLDVLERGEWIRHTVMHDRVAVQRLVDTLSGWLAD